MPEKLRCLFTGDGVMSIRLLNLGYCSLGFGG
jgi:hypothetical protein